tara:strand:- start:515 stop:700 length:186 start_codon:yes stop_codon:yes gene_type:complete
MAAIGRSLEKMNRTTEEAKIVLEDKSDDIIAVKEVLRSLINQMDLVYEDLGELYDLIAPTK